MFNLSNPADKIWLDVKLNFVSSINLIGMSIYYNSEALVCIYSLKKEISMWKFSHLSIFKDNLRN